MTNPSTNIRPRGGNFIFGKPAHPAQLVVTEKLSSQTFYRTMPVNQTTDLFQSLNPLALHRQIENLLAKGSSGFTEDLKPEKELSISFSKGKILM